MDWTSPRAAILAMRLVAVGGAVAMAWVAWLSSCALADGNGLDFAWYLLLCPLFGIHITLAWRAAHLLRRSTSGKPTD